MPAHDAQCIPLTRNVSELDMLNLFSFKPVYLEDLVGRFILLALPDLVYQAVAKMVLHKEVFDVRERLLDGGSLGDDVHAIGALINHFLQASYLSLDQLETAGHGFCFVHRNYPIPLGGYSQVGIRFSLQTEKDGGMILFLLLLLRLLFVFLLAVVSFGHICECI